MIYKFIILDQGLIFGVFAIDFCIVDNFPDVNVAGKTVLYTDDISIFCVEQKCRWSLSSIIKI